MVCSIRIITLKGGGGYPSMQVYEVIDPHCPEEIPLAGPFTSRMAAERAIIRLMDNHHAAL